MVKVVGGWVESFPISNIIIEKILIVRSLYAPVIKCKTRGGGGGVCTKIDGVVPPGLVPDLVPERT